MHFNPEDSFANGKYRLIEVIGDGSDAQVWLAHERRVQRDVVIKVLREPNVDVGARHRFEVEARALGAINHDGVIKLLEYSSERDAPSYMVLDHGGTKTLLDCIKGECEVFNTMGSRERLAKFNVVIEGLAVAHTGVNCEIIHRDIKPNNILWDGSRFRLCDFGRCSVDGISGGDVSGQFIGNFVNPAPEQFFEKPIVTTETDVFNIVAAMHSMLTGDSIYQVEGLFGTQEAAIAGRIVWSAAFKKIDKSLRAIIENGLKYNREERYLGAGSLHSDIARYLNNEKVSVSIETPYQKGRRWVKRYPWPTALLSSLVIVAGLAIYIAYQERVSRQQTQHILHAFGGLLQSIDPLLPATEISSQSDSLAELQATLDVSTNLSDAVRVDLYYALGARYMQLSAFKLASESFYRSIILNSGVPDTAKDATDDLARINIAWCLREGAHLLSGPEGLSPKGKAEYARAISFVFPISDREWTLEDTEENYIILLAKNRYASILLSSDEHGVSDTIELLLSLDAELRRKADSGSRHLAPWLLPVNSGNLGSAYMNVHEVDAEGERIYLAADKSLEWHKRSEQDFVDAGLAFHPEMAFAYRGQAEAYFARGENDKGVDCLRRAFQHRRDIGDGYTNNHLSELINFLEALVEHGNNSESAADEILRLEDAFCELMHSPRLEKGIHSSVHEFHNDHCQNNK